MSDLSASLSDEVVLAAPVVAQLELGSVTLAAEDWARLQTGDILTADAVDAEHVALRVGGKILAWGELVLVDGRPGVRIQRMVTRGNKGL
jgi:flagellar motor switch/type III secretory pathway protein FliN